MKLASNVRVRSPRAKSRGCCPGDAPVLSVSPAGSDLELIYSPDGKHLLACIIAQPVAPDVVQRCLAFGNGWWINSEHLTTHWGVWAVLTEEYWAAGMFVAEAPKPKGVPFRFL